MGGAKDDMVGEKILSIDEGVVKDRHWQSSYISRVERVER